VPGRCLTEKKKYYFLIYVFSTLTRITVQAARAQSSPLKFKNIQRIISVNKCSYTHMTHSACSVYVELQYPFLKLHIMS